MRKQETRIQNYRHTKTMLVSHTMDQSSIRACLTYRLLLDPEQIVLAHYRSTMRRQAVLDLLHVVGLLNDCKRRCPLHLHAKSEEEHMETDELI